MEQTGKIAIISDIHGNVPALRAVLQDIRERSISRIICLGDIVGKGPNSDEAVDLIRSNCEAVIQGNWDVLMGSHQVSEDYAWHQRQLGQSRIQYLSSLPFSIDFRISGNRVRLFHASATSVFHRVQPWDSLESRLALFHNTDQTGTPEDGCTPDIIGYGDVHQAFIQHLNGKTLFNAGSVGNPLELPLASYAIMEGVLDSEIVAPYSIQFIRLPYDIEWALHLAKQANMPSFAEYQFELTTAKTRALMKK